MKTQIFGDFGYQVKDNKSIILTKYNGTGGNVIIPDLINGLPITCIGDFLFANCTSLTNVGIPTSVTSIGKSAFYKCKYLTNVIIPDGVTIIKDAAFQHCYGLISITISNSITSIGDYTFYQCPSLNSIYFLGNVPTLNVSMFIGDSGVTIYEWNTASHPHCWKKYHTY